MGKCEEQNRRHFDVISTFRHSFLLLFLLIVGGGACNKKKQAATAFSQIKYDENLNQAFSGYYIVQVPTGITEMLPRLPP